jgi:hypothetical protein
MITFIRSSIIFSILINIIGYFKNTRDAFDDGSKIECKGPNRELAIGLARLALLTNIGQICENYDLSFWCA